MSTIVGYNPRFENISPDYLVYISSSNQNINVVAKMPDEIAMIIQSEWESALDIPGVGTLEKIAQTGFGYSVKTQRMSAQVWGGNSPVELNLPLEFNAESDALSEVMAPIKALGKMALPTASGGGNGLLMPPGPRIFSLSSQTSNDQIVVRIGNYLTLTNVILLEASPTFKSRLDFDGIPMKATVNLRVRTMLSMTTQDYGRVLEG